MGSIMQFGMALGLAGSAGVRAYFPLIIVGLLARFSETITVKPPLTIISSLPLLFLLAILAVFELMPELTPGVEDNQLMVMPFIRGLAGAVLFTGVFTGFGSFFGFIFGAIAAVLAYLVTVRLKAIYQHTAGYQRRSLRTNGIEEIITIVGTLLALLLPWAWYIIWGMVILYLLKNTKESQHRFRSQAKPKSWR